MEKQWSELTPEEKRDERFKRWLEPEGINFINAEAEKTYKPRATSLMDAIKMKEPDRVPCLMPSGPFPAYYAGITVKKAMYDYNEIRRVWLKFIYDIAPDACDAPGFAFPGRVYEIMDHRLNKWPGHGLPDNATFHQFVEGD